MMKTGTEAEEAKENSPKEERAGRKISCMAALCGMLVLIVFLIPANIFLVNFPGWVMGGIFFAL